MTRFKDITGIEHPCLDVLQFAYRDSKMRITYWQVRCRICGETSTKRYSTIMQKYNSCGCKRHILPTSWTPKEIRQLASASTRLTTKALAKSMKTRSEIAIQVMRSKTKRTIRNMIKENDKVFLQDVANRYGLDRETAKRLMESGYISYKQVRGQYYTIPVDDLFKLDDLFENHWSLHQVARYIGMDSRLIRDNLTGKDKCELMFHNVQILPVNPGGVLSDIYIPIEQVKLFKQQLKDTLLVKDFAKKVNRANITISELCKTNKLKHIVFRKKYRVFKSEMCKFNKKVLYTFKRKDTVRKPPRQGYIYDLRGEFNCKKRNGFYVLSEIKQEGNLRYGVLNLLNKNGTLSVNEAYNRIECDLQTLVRITPMTFEEFMNYER